MDNIGAGAARVDTVVPRSGIADTEKEAMAMPKPLHQRGPDQAVGTDDQNAHDTLLSQSGGLLRRALVSGSAASLLSTVVITLFSRHHAGAASAGTNATSHWFWGARARRRDSASLRYTGNGYAIHHAMSVFWAAGFEAATRHARRPVRIAAAAAGTAAMAYAVDYHVVPRRLNPGFESRLPPRAMLATYVAFAAGLSVAGWMRARHEMREEAAKHGAGRSSVGKVQHADGHDSHVASAPRRLTNHTRRQ